MKTWAPLGAAPVGYMTGDILGISGFVDALLDKYTDMNLEDPTASDRLSLIVGALSYVGGFFTFWKSGTVGKAIAWFSLGVAFSLFMALKSGVVA